MAEQSKTTVDIQLPTETVVVKRESTTSSGAGDTNSVIQEMPTITTLLQRKRLGSSAKTAPVANPVQPTVQIMSEIPVESEPSNEAPAIAPAQRRRGATVAQSENIGVEPSQMRGEPPTFSSTLILEKLDFKMLEKSIKKHKKSLNLKKLDCLGYFSSRFVEIAYYIVAQPGVLTGRLGFGNNSLVVQTRAQSMSAQTFPSIFDLLAQGEVFVGSAESLRAEDQAGLAQLGFMQASSCVALFPVMMKKNLAGIWICASPHLVEIEPKEIKNLKKLFTNLEL